MKYTMIHTVKAWDWDDNTPHKITVRKANEEYRVDVDKEFWATCESMAQVGDEINDIMNIYRWKMIPCI